MPSKTSALKNKKTRPSEDPSWKKQKHSRLKTLGRTLYTTLKPRSRISQGVKTGSKWVAGVGFFTLPFVGRQLYKLTKKDRRLEKAQKNLYRYNTKMSKARGNDGSYTEQLVKANLEITKYKPLIRKGTSEEIKKEAKERVKQAELTQKFIATKLEHTNYRAIKLMESMGYNIFKESIAAAKQNEDIQARTKKGNDGNMFAMDKIRHFLQKQSENGAKTLKTQTSNMEKQYAPNV